MKKLLPVITGLIFCISVHAQSISPSVISAGGDFYVSGNVSLSWTIGETVVETYKTGNNILTQGFQQPSYDVSSIENPENSSVLDVNVYPVPAVNTLNIDFLKTSMYSANAELYDFYGKQLLSKSYSPPLSLLQIDFSGYSAGTYVLKLSVTGEQGHPSVRYFKVIKN